MKFACFCAKKNTSVVAESNPQTFRSTTVHALYGCSIPYCTVTQYSPLFLQARERLERRRVARLHCGDAPPPSLTFIHGARAPALQPLRQTPLRVGIAKLGGVEVLVTRARQVAPARGALACV